MNQSIKLIPNPERPRERCLNLGAHSLSLRECLALILGSGPRGIGCMGLANRILTHPGEGFHCEDLERAFFISLELTSASYLKEIGGLGPAGQARILASFEMGRRYFLFKCQENKEIQTSQLNLPALAFNALNRLPATARSDPQEWLGFVPIYRNGQVGMFNFVEKGVRTHVNIEPAELFARVLILRPEGFLLFHNHPSGQLKPSLQDLELTEKVGEIANQLGIRLLGHWIVTLKGEYWISSDKASVTQFSTAVEPFD